MSSSALEPFARKLQVHSRLSAEERAALLDLRFEVRSLRACAPLFRGTGPTRHCYVLLDGYAARYKLLRDGSRQMLNLVMKGDAVGLQRSLSTGPTMTSRCSPTARLR